MNLKTVSLAAVTLCAFARLPSPPFLPCSMREDRLHGRDRQGIRMDHPHSWLRIMSKIQAARRCNGDRDGFAGAAGARRLEARFGKSGDKVTVTIHPLKDGSRADNSMFGGACRAARTGGWRRRTIVGAIALRYRRRAMRAGRIV